MENVKIIKMQIVTVTNTEYVFNANVKNKMEMQIHC